MNFEAFFWSLTQQESGGSYSAVGAWVNGHRAYGAYQVMDFNIGPWTAKYLGRRLTPQQFLNSRRAQDTVARERLREYVRKYGYRGAASAWYSGDPDLHMSTRSQPSGPSIKGYVDSVMSRAQNYRGGGGGGGSSRRGPSYMPEAVTPKLSEDELAERYGLTASLINSDRELKRLFNKAVSGQWTAERFQASLRNTKWWKTQSSDLRKFITLKHTDPATWRANWRASRAEVNSWAIEMGLSNQVKNDTASKLLKEAVHKRLALGWAEARLRDWLGRKVKMHDGQMWGEAGEVFDKLHELAWSNGIDYSEGWFAARSRDIVGGRSTVQTQESKIRAAAAAKYSAWADQIKAGQNVMDLASPYIQSFSEILEIAPGAVDLKTGLIESAMTSKKPTPMWEFQRKVRNDPRWRKTNNAREGLMSVAHQVARDFGVAV